MTNYPLTENIDGTRVITFENQSQLIYNEMWKDYGLLPPIELRGKWYRQTDYDMILKNMNPVMARRGRTLIAVSSVIVFIGTLFVLARIYVKKRVLRHFYIDDWFISVSVISGLFAFASWVPVAVKYIDKYDKQARVPLYDFSSQIYSNDDAFMLYKYARVCRVLIVAFTIGQATFGRLSIMYTFYRLSITGDDRSLKLRLVIHIVAVFMVLSYIPLSWLSIDPCWPPTGIKASLEPDPNPSKCLYIGPEDTIMRVGFQTWAMLFTAIFNAIVDMFCFTLPFFVFHGTIMSRAKLWSLYGLFSFGLGILLLSILRGVETVNTIKRTNDFQYDSIMDDEFFAPYVWGLAEAQGVMIGACLPVLAKPFWRWLQPYWRKISPPPQRKESAGYDSITLKGYSG